MNMTRPPSEVDQIGARYARRHAGDLYSMLRPEVQRSTQELERAIVAILKRLSVPVGELRLLEAGCGSGNNLTMFIRLGFDPGRLVGNELLPDRVFQARRNLPAATTILEGDAAELDVTSGSFDIVYCSLVFSSILSDDFQQRLAVRLWDLVAPGGGLLWYDFVYDNPSNKDVRGVSLRRIRELFPAAVINFRRLTLAPPLSRRVCRVWPGAYDVLNAFPFLRTHVLCWLRKPR
jgi:SAM-dependent methyltransferase